MYHMHKISKLHSHHFSLTVERLGLQPLSFQPFSSKTNHGHPQPLHWQHYSTLSKQNQQIKQHWSHCHWPRLDDQMFPIMGSYRMIQVECGCVIWQFPKVIKWCYPQVITLIEFSIIKHPFWGSRIQETPRCPSHRSNIVLCLLHGVHCVAILRELFPDVQLPQKEKNIETASVIHNETTSKQSLKFLFCIYIYIYAYLSIYLPIYLI